MSTGMCHCGLPLHYSEPKVQLYVERMVRRLGEYIIVNINGRRWKVPRHYIALHGLKAQGIETLGFEEV